MRIDGVAASSAHPRTLQRSESRPAPEAGWKRFRFSDTGVILDLTADAVERTGRHDIRRVRQRHDPPETYTEAGMLAYYPPPAPREVTGPPFEYGDGGREEASLPPGVSSVTFDGMLNAPARARIRLGPSHQP